MERSYKIIPGLANRPHLMGMQSVCSLILALIVIVWPAFGQGPVAPEDKPDLGKAEKAADDFFRRLVRTKDFERVWKEFQAADQACFLRNNAFRPEGKATFADKELESYVTAAMALSFLTSAYAFSVERMRDDPSPRIFPVEVRRAAKSAKYSVWTDSDGEAPEPKNAAELQIAVEEINRFASMYKRAMPRNATNNAIWRWNMKKMRGVGGNTYSGVSTGSRQDCVAPSAKVYIIQRGPFQFVFTKEGKHMKIAQIGLGN